MESYVTSKKPVKKIHANKLRPPNPNGRPEAEIDWKKVDDLLVSGCTGTEVSSYLGINPDTFYKRVEKKYKVGFSVYLHQKRAKGDSILRAHQYAKALGLTDKGDNTLLIWLGKVRLEQKEPKEELKIAPNEESLKIEHENIVLRAENQKLKNAPES